MFARVIASERATNTVPLPDAEHERSLAVRPSCATPRLGAPSSLVRRLTPGNQAMCVVFARGGDERLSLATNDSSTSSLLRIPHASSQNRDPTPTSRRSSHQTLRTWTPWLSALIFGRRAVGSSAAHATSAQASVTDIRAEAFGSPWTNWQLV